MIRHLGDIHQVTIMYLTGCDMNIWLSQSSITLASYAFEGKLEFANIIYSCQKFLRSDISIQECSGQQMPPPPMTRSSWHLQNLTLYR